MVDRENVIVEIEDALSGNLAKVGHVYNLSLNGLKDKALTDALSLLKKQRPQSVLSNRVCEVEPFRYVRKGFCPKCHQELEWLLNRKHCGFCGQELKWE